jgi:hypothetical protein
VDHLGIAALALVYKVYKKAPVVNRGFCFMFQDVIRVSADTSGESTLSDRACFFLLSARR